MSTSVKLTVKAYQEAIARGDFTPEEMRRLELIRGEIVAKRESSVINPPHCDVVDQLNEWACGLLPLLTIRVRIQGSLAIPELDSVPEPVVMLLARKDYSREHPVPADVLLLIEVASTSLDDDRGTKATLYAEAGIADYWIVNLVERCLEVRREPRGATYQTVTTLRSGETVEPLAFPAVRFPVSLIFPD